VNSAFNIPHSPVAALGTIILLIAFLVAAYGATAGIIGNVQKRRRLVNSSVYSCYAFFALMMVASALIIYAFVTHDYTIKYVSRYSDTSMPLSYKITAYWGGLDGSLMFWVSVLSAFTAVAVVMNRKRHRDMIGFVVAVSLIVQLFFLALLIYTKNPFATYLTTPPLDGEGLNPLLQNYWMVIHPPALYIGFVAATIPFAFGIAALASGRLDDQWLGSVRAWMFICWFFLSLGLILGGRWAYEELGWGGYWAWDPVENAGLLPWFTATAFLHSVMIQEQRGMMKSWNMVLVITTFWLTIFGTFMTRSGVVQSVHAFGEDNELAMLFIIFMAFILIVSFGLLIFRSQRLRSANHFESFVSREFAFLLNNWILLGCAGFVLFATMFPTLSEAVDGERITVGPAFFNKWMTPLGLILIFLAGAAPLLAWRRTTSERLYSQFLFPVAATVGVMGLLAVFMPQTHVRTSVFSDKLSLPITLLNFGLVTFTIACCCQEFWKGTRVRMRQSGSGAVTSLLGLILFKRRKYGGYLIHMSVAVMFLGFAGAAYESMRDVTMTKPGETFEMRGYTFVYEDLYLDDSNSEHVLRYVAKVGLYEGDTRLTTLQPERRDYAKSDQPTTEVAIKSFIDEDVYMILTGFELEKGIANLRAKVNPLVNWVWIGFLFLIFGTAICLFPKKWVDNLSPRRRTRAGRATEVAIIVATVGAMTFGLVSVGHAQPTRKAPVEHVDDRSAAGRLGHNDGVGYAHLCRPEHVSQENARGIAAKAMKELVCLCGGCKRENLYECRCGYAMQERCKVIEQLEAMDWGDSKQADQAYDAVIDAFIAEYGGQHVLSTPRNKLSWMFPYLAIAGGLLMLAVVGRRWVQRGRAVEEENASRVIVPSAEDEEYADILDDELAETD
jgi:cytochrome c-type biogenesis protein CcmF